jgi:peptide-methionine (S)-S-oxide reductase
MLIKVNIQWAQIALMVVIAIAATACNTVNSSNHPAAEMNSHNEPASEGAMQRAETAVFAGGCFWGVEAIFEHVKGVKDVRSGYSGGDARSAKYELVSSGRTEHAEAVEIVFDPTKISYAQLLTIFFSVAHDPTQVDRQGPDVGRHYRSAIFYIDDTQLAAAMAFIQVLSTSGAFDQKIATEVVPLKKFHRAETYHQDYMRKNPDQAYIVQHDRPKLVALKNTFPDLFIPKYFK